MTVAEESAVGPEAAAAKEGVPSSSKDAGDGGEEVIYEKTQEAILVMKIITPFLLNNMTVTVTDSTLSFTMGTLKTVQRSYPLATVDTAEVVKHKLYSWGIHYVFGKGWYYNVAGFGAVYVKFKDGNGVIIGTPEPQVLERVILQAAAAKKTVSAS